MILTKRYSSLKRMALATVLIATSAASLAHAGNGHVTSRATPAWCGDRCDEVVLDWSTAAHRILTQAQGYADPLSATRSLAMMHLAMHDAVNAVDARYASYLPTESNRAADPVVAAASAAHGVLLALYPSEQATLDAVLAETLLDAGLGESVERGRALGSNVANAMVEARANDGANGSEPYQPGTAPGRYRFKPGAEFIFAPHWRKVTPFGLQSPSMFRSAPPPALTSGTYTKAFAEVQSKGRVDSTTRTRDETEYAAFWYEFSDIGWNRLARTVARERRQDLWRRARTFALLNVALADSYIAGWDSKLHYDFWRPTTAIPLADIDGNAATTPDATWTEFLPTPPIQDYPSTHSVLGAAAAAVLTDAFGHNVRFTLTSGSADPTAPRRSFKSFTQAASENASSRVMSGLHFRFSCDAGLQLGYRVGQHATQQLLAPLK
jgi:hypothetical protein